MFGNSTPTTLNTGPKESCNEPIVLTTPSTTEAIGKKY
jgi:hypothetical protein